MPDITSPRWSVAILSAREDLETLLITLDASLAALSGQDAVVDVLVNGHGEVAHEFGRAVQARAGLPDGVRVRVWELGLRDKAHAWNTYVHELWPGSVCTFFVDGYASVQPDAFSRLDARLAQAPEAVAAAAVPTVGRSAAQVRAWMLEASQIHGSLYAVRGEALTRMRASGFRLPLGFYRTDALLGTLFNFNLDPPRHPWDERGIVVAADATWTIRVSSLWRVADLGAQTARVFRQAVGRFEEAAIKEHLYDRRRSPLEIPSGPMALVDTWMRRHPASALRLLARHPLALVRLALVRWRTDWRLREDAPRCVYPS